MSEHTQHTAWNNILYAYKIDIVFVLSLSKYFNVSQMITFCFFLDFHTIKTFVKNCRNPYEEGRTEAVNRHILYVVYNDYSNRKLNAVKKKASPEERNSYYLSDGMYGFFTSNAFVHFSFYMK